MVEWMLFGQQIEAVILYYIPQNRNPWVYHFEVSDYEVAAEFVLFACFVQLWLQERACFTRGELFFVFGVYTEYSLELICCLYVSWLCVSRFEKGIEITSSNYIDVSVKGAPDFQEMLHHLDAAPFGFLLFFGFLWFSGFLEFFIFDAGQVDIEKDQPVNKANCCSGCILFLFINVVI